MRRFERSWIFHAELGKGRGQSKKKRKKKKITRLFDHRPTTIFTRDSNSKIYRRCFLDWNFLWDGKRNHATMVTIFNGRFDDSIRFLTVHLFWRGSWWITRRKYWSRVNGRANFAPIKWICWNLNENFKNENKFILSPFSTIETAQTDFHPLTGKKQN